MTVPSLDSARDGAYPALRVVVVGCGHVGAVTAAGLAELGHDVTGHDIAPDLVESLNRGQHPFLEPGLSDLILGNLRAGRLRFRAGALELGEAEVVMVCVDTPSGEPQHNMSRIRGALASIAAAQRAAGSEQLIIVKSTTPPGAADALAAEFRSALEPGVSLVLNPEFLREGRAVEDFFRPDRIVVGAEDELRGRTAAALFERLNAPVITTNRRTAELIKHAANAFLATRVSFINEMARLCELADGDIDALRLGIGSDHRIGEEFLQPGIGFGGSCLPRDVSALVEFGSSHGEKMPLLRSVREVNLRQHERARDVLASALGGLAGRRIAVWGVTFKAGSEDLRESPALAVVRLLVDAGAEVAINDPGLPPAAGVPLHAHRAPTALACVDGADALAVLTDWPQFGQIDLLEVRRRMRGCVVFDGRGGLDSRAVAAAGLSYHGVGVGSRGSPVDMPEIVAT